MDRIPLQAFLMLPRGWRGHRAGGGGTQGAAVCTPAGEAAPGTEPDARRRRSNRPGNSQAKGLRGEGRSGKQRAEQAIGPLTEGVSRVSVAPSVIGGRAAVNLSGFRTEGASPGR